MKLELIDSKEELEGTWYFEFAVGEDRGQFWCPGSVYLDEDAFSLIEKVVWQIVPGFDPCGPPSTISGRRIEQLAVALREFAKAVARTEEAKDFRSLARVPEEAQDQIEDWRAAKPQLCLMLRDLERWLLAVKARKQPVTILGL